MAFNLLLGGGKFKNKTSDNTADCLKTPLPTNPTPDKKTREHLM